MITIEPERPATVTLAIVAIHPDRQGIGSDLVRAGIENALSQGYNLVFLHGDPDFYGRFGFESAVPVGVETPLDLPDPDFQVCELTIGAIEGCRRSAVVSGSVRWRVTRSGTGYDVPCRSLSPGSDSTP